MGNAERAPRPRAPLWLRPFRVGLVLAVTPFGLAYRIFSAVFDGVLIVGRALVDAVRGL
jgi:hypothetical protein